MDKGYITSEAIDMAAVEKANMSPQWKPYRYEWIEGGILVKGCNTKEKKSGPDKGGLIFLKKEDSKTVIVTRKDIKKWFQSVNRNIVQMTSCHK